MAVNAWSAFSATVAMVDVVRSVPSSCHFWNVLPLAVTGAMYVAVAFWLNMRVKGVAPPKVVLLSGILELMLTPLLGFDDATVTVCVTGSAAE